MEIRNLKNSSIAELTNCFNASFANYMVPLQLTEEQLQQKFVNDHTVLEFSAGAYEGDTLVGFIFTGIDIRNGKKMGYNGGTGVLPEYRGRRLTAKMYDFLIPKLKKEGVKSCILEVIESNVPAIKTYENIGFKKVRELVSFKGFPNGEISVPHHIQISENFANLKITVDFCDFEASWQNSEAAVKRSQSNLNNFIIQEKEEPIAFIIFNPDNGRISQFGVSKDHRRKGYATILFKKVSQHLQRPLTLINIDRRSTASIDFLSGIGLEPFLTQLEMEMEL